MYLDHDIGMYNADKQRKYEYHRHVTTIKPVVSGASNSKT